MGALGVKNIAIDTVLERGLGARELPEIGSCDSDSTACLAGQLWGAAHGLVGMPHDWLVDVDVSLPLLRLGRQLIIPEFR